MLAAAIVPALAAGNGALANTSAEVADRRPAHGPVETPVVGGGRVGELIAPAASISAALSYSVTPGATTASLAAADLSAMAVTATRCDPTRARR
jgi:hypothetical protein